jgi:ribulose-phosphate 3-epimerase
MERVVNPLFYIFTPQSKTTMQRPLVAPSLLSADFSRLKEEIEMINESEADWFHLDIMDGNFVPNLSFGFPVIEAIARYAKKPLDMHLMIAEPDRYIERFAGSGAHMITVHYEACNHLHRTLDFIRSLGVKAGVSLNPHSSVALLDPILDEVDLVLIMSVNPGFGGQKFILHSLDKIRILNIRMKKRNIQALIEVDGGVDASNAAALVQAGAGVLVAGNSIFGSPDPKAIISRLKAIMD